MAKTVTFIQKIEGKRFTERDLVAIKRAGGEGFFAVPESHAEMNMRRSDNYQEVDIDRITVLAAKTRRKAVHKTGLGTSGA